MGRYFPGERISVIHGQARVVNQRLIVPMYHPAAALHQPSLRQVVKDDFSRLPDMIAKGESVLPSADAPSSDPEQLNLF